MTGEKLSSVIYISKGEETFEMPDLTGLKLNMATNIIKSFDLVLEDINYDYNDIQPADSIFAQKPVPGSIISKSTKVALSVSQGENPEGTVPDVIGMTEEEALGQLNSNGYFNISITLDESEEEISKVFSQVPENGTVYDKTNEIFLRFSIGIKVPDVIGLDLADALIILEDSNFLVEIVPGSDATGKVISQVPIAEEYMNYGSIVSIEIKEPIEEGGGDGDGDGGGE